MSGKRGCNLSRDRLGDESPTAGRSVGIRATNKSSFGSHCSDNRSQANLVYSDSLTKMEPHLTILVCGAPTPSDQALGKLAQFLGLRTECVTVCGELGE